MLGGQGDITERDGVRTRTQVCACVCNMVQYITPKVVGSFQSEASWGREFGLI
jgi:hypothetical protein